MADWRKVALGSLLVDGKIDKREIKILEHELLADERVTRDEADFLIDLRNRAKSVSPAFLTLFFDAIKQCVLYDHTVSDTEAKWLRKMIYADDVVDDGERQLVIDLMAEAEKVGAGFQALHDEITASAAGKG